MRPGRPEAVFLPEWTRPGMALYGPQLPVPAGRYRAETVFDAAGEAGETVGELRVASARDGTVFGRVALRAGETAAATEAFAVPSEPLRFETLYEGKGELVVRELRLVPVTEGPREGAKIGD